VFPGQTLSASTYNVSQDGRGTATLNTPQGNFGLEFVLTATGHGLITRFDGNGTGSGTLDLQGSASQSALTSLAFSLSGADASQNPLGTLGAFTLNASGSVTSGIEDINDNGSSTGGLTGLPLATTSSLVLSSATNGTAQLDSSFGSLAFDVFVIDSTHLKLIETDTSGPNLSGDVFTQQTSFPAGQLVFAVGGLDISGNPVSAGGFVTTDASGNLTNGNEDYNNLLTANTVSFSGTCNATAPFAAGRCQLALTTFTNGTASNLKFAAYPSSGGIQLLEIDSLGFMQGTAYAQTATSFTAPAGYGLNLSGTNTDGFGDFGEVDDIAQFNATSTNMTGVLDENSFLAGPTSSSLKGTYAADSPATGRGGISVTTPNTFIGGLSLEYYVIDASDALFIEGDSSQVAMGIFVAQSSSSAAAARPAMPMVRSMARSHAAIRRK
jgi:hypothetical protein